MYRDHNYFVYITTNETKRVLYIGVTNDLYTRLEEHFENSKSKKTFAGRYNCYYLVYWERYSSIEHAIEREKELKGWTRKKKEILISSINPEWEFYNNII